MATRCPHCKRLIPSNSQRSHTFESSARSPLRQSATPPLYPPPLDIQRPLGLPTMESNVHVPANQAIFSGCLLAPAVGMIASSVSYIWFTAGSALIIGGISGWITFFLVATYKWHTKMDFYDSLLQQIETAFDVDLDGDGNAGPPTIKVEVKSEDGNRWQFADLPGKPEALQDFAKRVLMGQGFTDETGKLAGLTQDEVKNLREAFVEKGWAGWKHSTRKQQGIDVLHVGKSVLRAIAASPSPTLSASA